MAVFKCKMCGGSLEVTEGMTVCECEYCGTKQTLPKTDNEQALNMFNRANHFRQQCEFDKAAEIYERMTAQRDDAELYWSIVLCRYGIEYVDDPLTKKKIPTCHRTQYKSILEDADYLEALSHADSVQKEVYKQEAEYIDKVQKGILEISNKEKPFDVFICYKETDDMGRRTPDSVLAQDLYYGLVKEGFKVFFSRITLESKLGTEYEPYIFAALNSAKVMVVVGTKPEYFNAVWVRNEWSRYLMLMQEDRSRTLIPAYKDMDPYDLPDALSMFQAQDMSKLGFMQDLIHGIKKIVATDEPKKEVVKETVVRNSSGNVENLLKRGNLALEDGKWNDAKGYFDQVLNEDVEEHRAYIGFLCAEYGIANEQMLLQVNDDFTKSEYYQKACRFGGEEVKNRLYGYYLQSRYNHALNVLNNAKTVEDCIKAKELFEWLGEYSDAQKKAEDCEEKRKSIIYSQAEEIMKIAVNNDSFTQAAKLYESLGGYRDSEKKAEQCRNKAKAYIAKVTQEKKQGIYDNALKAIKDKDSYSESDIKLLENSIKDLKALGDFKDSKEQIKNCETKIVEIEEYLQKKKEAEAKERNRQKRIMIIGSISVVAISTVIIVFFTVFVPMIKYSNGKKLLDDGKYDEALEIFEKMNDYRDSAELIKKTKFQKAVALGEENEYDEAIEILDNLGDYEGAEKEKLYISGLKYIKEKSYERAKTAVSTLGEYKESAKIKEEAEAAIKAAEEEKKDNEYTRAIQLLEDKNYYLAATLLIRLGDYKDAKTKLEKAKEEVYNQAKAQYNKGEYDDAKEKFEIILDYKDSRNYSFAQMDIYNEGVTALKSKNYEKSYRVFTYLKDYKDSIEKTIASVVGTDNYKKAIDLCKNKGKSIRTVCQNNGLADKYTLLVKNFTKFTGTFEKTYRGKIYVKFDEKNMCLVLEHISGNIDVKRVIEYTSVIGHSSFHDEDNIYEVYENYIIYLNNEKFVKIA